MGVSDPEADAEVDGVWADLGWRSCDAYSMLAPGGCSGLRSVRRLVWVPDYRLGLLVLCAGALGYAPPRIDMT